MKFSEWIKLAEEKRKKLKDPLSRKRPEGPSFYDHTPENLS